MKELHLSLSLKSAKANNWKKETLRFCVSYLNSTHRIVLLWSRFTWNVVGDDRTSMKQSQRWQRTLILCLLSLSVVTPLVFVSRRLQVLTRDGTYLYFFLLLYFFSLSIIHFFYWFLFQVEESFLMIYPVL